MGIGASRLVKRLLSKRQIKLLMVGLDASGKTTILYKLKLGEVVQTIPTIALVEMMEYKNISFAVWDIGGQEKIRALWKHYFLNTKGLIFVVDSSDRERIVEARNQLHQILGDQNELNDAAILVFANKQDLPNAMSSSEVANKLGLHSLHHHLWYIQSASAISGHGLCEGLDWLSKSLCSKPT